MKDCNINTTIRTLRFLNNEMTQKELADKVDVQDKRLLPLKKASTHLLLNWLSKLLWFLTNH